MAGDRFVVLGGGVVGLSVARELAGRGARVLLLEAREVGAGASTAAVGVLVPAPGRSALAELSRAGYDLYPTLARELGDETGIDIGYRECGSITLAGELPRRPERQLRSRRETGREVAWLDRGELERRIPGYGGRADTGLWVAREAVVHPPALLEALRRSARTRGVTIGEGSGELSLEKGASPSRITVECERLHPAALLSELSGAGVVVAAGAWSSRALAKLGGARVAVEPVRGQALELRHPAPESIVHFQPDPGGKSYFLVPREADRVWVGSTVEEVGFDDRTTPEGRRELLAAARWVLSSVRESDVTRLWSGLRPRAMRRGGPFLGPWPGVTNLWVACGHYRSGILKGPVSARILYDHILHGGSLPEEFAVLPC